MKIWLSIEVICPRLQRNHKSPFHLTSFVVHLLMLREHGFGRPNMTRGLEQ
jgi:hypothetical protein